ncbi:hypothetical protein P7C70_g5518, partial [Phenoliferia sp. Uapishka_3]
MNTSNSSTGSSPWMNYPPESEFAANLAPIFNATYGSNAEAMRVRSSLPEGLPGVGGFSGYDATKSRADQHPYMSPSRTSRPSHRRAASTASIGSLAHTMTTSTSSNYSYHDPSTPGISSPASEVIDTPRDGLGTPFWYKTAQDSFAGGQHHAPIASKSYLPPPPRSQAFYPPSPVYYPASPSSTSHVGQPSGIESRRRHQSHQSHLSPTHPSENSSRSHYSPARNLSITLPPPPPALSAAYPTGAPYSAPPVSQQMVHTSSVEEVDQVSHWGFRMLNYLF